MSYKKAQLAKNQQHAEGSKKQLSAKGQKAQAKLKAAALVVLEDVGYHKMRITDVTKQAGVAAGLFYHYFDDLKSLTKEVLGDFVATSLDVEKIEKDVAKGDWYGRIEAHNRLVVRSYSERPGIMRCLLQLADEDPEFSALLRQGFLEQLSWLTRKMPRLFPNAGFGEDELGEKQSLLVLYTLSGMAETLLRDYYINEEPMLRDPMLNDEAITELLSVLFYRGLFLQQPPAERLKYSRYLENMYLPKP